MAQERPGLAVIGAEYRALDKVPPRARVFGFWDQVTLWFGAASLPAAWPYGGIMAGWQGIGGALLLIVVVRPLTLLPWAFLGYIAAKTGGASVAIVRPAFGLRGSTLPALAYLVFGFGWAPVNVLRARPLVLPSARASGREGRTRGSAQQNGRVRAAVRRPGTTVE